MIAILGSTALGAVALSLGLEEREMKAELQIRTIKERDGFTACINLVVYSASGLPEKCMLRWRRTGFRKRSHARSNARSNSRNILAYALGDMERLAQAELHWEQNGRNCCPVWRERDEIPSVGL